MSNDEARRLLEEFSGVDEETGEKYHLKVKGAIGQNAYFCDYIDDNENVIAKNIPCQPCVMDNGTIEVAILPMGNDDAN
ncbi:hypothetical protein IKF15_02630 [Candidatus Saccharibacteria bacterium]|nr:hypothetical protein [Candidatus Saccharibacteria bacterium]